MKLKNIYNIPICIFMLTLCLIGCDKLDENGKLDGNWQMTEWIQNNSGDTLAQKSDLLFYTIKLELIQFRNSKNGQLPYLAYFTYTGDSLFIGDVFSNTANSDIPATTDDLKSFGVEDNGKFKIQKLTSSEMILQNNINTLYFRKY